MTFGPSIECGSDDYSRGPIDRSFDSFMNEIGSISMYIRILSNPSRLGVNEITSEIRFIIGDVSFSTFIKMDRNLVSNTSIHIYRYFGIFYKKELNFIYTNI